MDRLAFSPPMSFLLQPPTGNALGQQKAQEPSDVDSVNTASQVFIAAISARNISAKDEVWAHEPYATFVAPSAQRFGQFDRVIISLAESHVHINGKVAWTVGTEKVELLRKDGSNLGFHAFVTNVFENHDGRWLMVSHHATPIFRGEK